MRKNKIISAMLSVALLFGSTTQVFAANISYLPYVTAEMSDPSYWTDDNEILMTEDEIKELNALTISTKGTNMNDLKNQPETVDGIALNKALKTSTQADVSYYLGWTYLDSKTLATQADFDPIIKNTQNKKPGKTQKVKYGIAVKSTALRSFPSTVPLWDDPTDKDLDYQYLTSVRVNEPLVITSVSADGNFYLAKNICCSGWVPVEDVAICSDKQEWLSAWDLPFDKSLIVYGDKVRTETSITGEKTSDLLLTMGTVLEMAEVENPDILIDNRAAYQNYVVYIPVRNEDGSYSKKQTLISEHEKVHDGYMPLTRNNIAKVALGALGNTYGWGGSLYSDDCSGYIRNIYKCFGFELARNTSWQTAMPMTGVDMTGMCREERINVMDSLPFGAILYFNGHEMLYLGSENGKYYVISAVGSIVLPFEGATRQRIRSTVINTLDIKRASGVTWLDDLTYANVPYWNISDKNAALLPSKTWYHDGVAFCIANKLMHGYEDSFFHPENEITFSQLMQLLYNIDGNKQSDDTSEKEWYTDAVLWATSANIITEVDAQSFEPDKTVSREQLVLALYQYARYKDYDVSVNQNTDVMLYDDASDISETAHQAFQYAVSRDIVAGKSETTLNPTDKVTRAEIASIIQRFVTSQPNE